MSIEQGEKNNTKNTSSSKKGEVLDNKKVIAEYDEVLNSEAEQEDQHLGKLEALKQRLGLGVGEFSSDIKTNLIDEDVATFIDWKSSLNIFISYFLIFLILLSGTFAYLVFLEKEEEKKVDIYDEDIQSTKDQIANEEKKVDEGLLFQKKVNALNSVLDNHVYWSNLFSYIEKNTLEEVVYDGFSGKLDGKYGLSGTANKLYFTAAEQIKEFKKDQLTLSAKTQELSLSSSEAGGEISFEINLEVNPDIFYKKE